MPGWLIAASLASLLALAAFLILFRQVWRMIARTRARRPDLSRAQFVASLSRDARPETAEFLWERMAFLLPTIAPHPDDHLWRDLPIEESEPMHEWLGEFAQRNGADPDAWPVWPAGAPHTVRNYARWLQLGLTRAG